MLNIPNKLPIPKLPEVINKLVVGLNAINGKPYLVGGGTIDIICSQEPKDWDIEVFGVSYEQLVTVAQNIGPADLIGSKFGVVKLKDQEIDIELSIPRTENKNGPKHQDFDVAFKCDLTIKEAAKRRDFTINCIYLDLETLEYIDPYDGINDLIAGKLHYVNQDTFIEDPLRAFRAVQLVARKGRTWTVGLNRLIGRMLPSLRHLTGDAILGEMNKLLMLANNPSIGLRHMVSRHPEIYGRGLINLFPELQTLIGCEQRKEYHPEGDVWNHTLMVIDEAAKWRDEIPEEWKLAFMWGMLLHDIGKPIATVMDEKKGHLTSISHDKLGEPLARTFMERLTNNKDLVDKICSIVKVHMRPRLLLKASPRRAAWRRLQNECPLDILAYVSMVDNDGRGAPAERAGKAEESFIKTMAIYKELGSPTAEIKPILMGRHLIEHGFQPGPKFGSMLQEAYEYQLETGCEDIEELYNKTIHLES